MTEPTVNPADATDKARSLWHPGARLTATARYRTTDVLGSHEHECTATWLPDTGMWLLPADVPYTDRLQVTGYSGFTLLELPE